MNERLIQILGFAGIILFFYLSLACWIFQIRNPKANDYAWIRHIPDVVTFEKLEQYQ